MPPAFPELKLAQLIGATAFQTRPPPVQDPNRDFVDSPLSPSLQRSGQPRPTQHSRCPQCAPSRAQPKKETRDSLDAEAEVELPSTDAGGEFSALVGEGEAELDDAEEVDVAPKGLVVVVGRAAEGADRAGDDSRELGVLEGGGGALGEQGGGGRPESGTKGEEGGGRAYHGYEGVFIDRSPDVGHLLVEVVGPYFSDSRTPHHKANAGEAAGTETRQGRGGRRGGGGEGEGGGGARRGVTRWAVESLGERAR